MALRFFWFITLALALVATAGFAAGDSDSDDPASAAEKEMVRDPTTGKMVVAPQYGGTLTTRPKCSMRRY
ncbi:MAG: hypothetical protein OXH96_03580 [Spirochaetaceae bacterium]|nr:hypothetical protein [Spirochaetaceae bacterium]